MKAGLGFCSCFTTIISAITSETGAILEGVGANILGFSGGDGDGFDGADNSGEGGDGPNQKNFYASSVAKSMFSI